ncbi:uncharacterized protein LOC132301637 [Cornus florida]|uniref:uncharacterized protein LOC132301637 n=1 Tax=Cornus florida TaxID=4283 RepID=UPI00289E0F4C|nr:uncharacterized protein LOC132301637 [Cornus florida]
MKINPAIPEEDIAGMEGFSSRSMSPHLSRSILDSSSSTGSHSASSPVSPRGATSPRYVDSLNPSHSTYIQVMMADTASVEEQLVTMARAIEKLTKTVEDKDLQIVSLMNKLKMFIGDGAKLVRDTFQLAKEKSPCIIFIDEIDAIGTKQFDSEVNGDREVQRTMLELLNQLDGFSSDERIKVTNRADILDPALIRSGRLINLLLGKNSNTVQPPAKIKLLKPLRQRSKEIQSEGDSIL